MLSGGDFWYKNKTTRGFIFTEKYYLFPNKNIKKYFEKSYRSQQMKECKTTEVT